MSSFSIKQNDLLPVLTATLMQGIGTSSEAVVDLTAATAVRFLMRPWVGGDPVIEDAAAFVSKPAGTVRYVWQDGDTDDPGEYAVEWEVTYPGGVATWPSMGYDLVVITDDIDSA